MSVVILNRQIGHYHDARFRSAARELGAVSVISTANEGAFKQFLAPEIGNYSVVRLFPNYHMFFDAVRSRKLLNAVGLKLSELKPRAVVVAGWANPESCAAIHWSLTNRVPVVVMSESQAFDADRRTLREALKSRVVHMCDAALVGGPSHRSYIEALGMPRHRIHLGYNAVDNQHFMAGADSARSSDSVTRAALHLPNRFILASGRFIKKKNFPQLVKAYADARSIVESGPDLVILGEGETHEEIRKAIAETSCEEKIHLLGFRGYDELPALYGLAEGFCHISTVEQWGLVVNEAMACSTPVIVSGSCGVSQALIKGGENGFVVDAADRKDIADTLVKFFRLPPERRLKIGKAGCATISDWGPAAFARGLSAAIEDAIAAPRKNYRIWDRLLLLYLSGRIIDDVA